METVSLSDERSYVESFPKVGAALMPDEAAWLTERRRAAIESFARQGFPTPKDEEWRFTNVAPIKNTTFTIPSRGEGRLSAESIEAALIPGVEAAATVVFVDGYYSPSLSRVMDLPEGVVLASLAEALRLRPELLEPHLARYADGDIDPFTALNTAYMQDGVLLYIPRRVRIEKPVYVLFASTHSEVPTFTNPRNLVVLEESAEGTLIEDYVSLGEGTHFSNVVTEIVAGENSVFSHYMLERENKRSYNISTLRMEQRRSSNLSSHSALFGGALVRNNVHPVLSGEGAYCLINGLFMGKDSQHLDNFMRVEHAAPHCDSRQFYYGILDDAARGVFSGKIVVHKDAQKTDAKQTNKNLLLSYDASIDTKPQLEIYADDVRCTHGATIGQMNKDAHFYLRTRGIPGDEARTMLLVAFAAEGLERMTIEPLRTYLEGVIWEWFGATGREEGFEAVGLG